MAPESPGNLVTLDLIWNARRLECQVERYDPIQGNEFLYVSWNAIECPKNYISIGEGVAYVWVPPGSSDSQRFSHREYRARVDATKDGFEWIDSTFGSGLMLILTFPKDYIYVFPPEEKLETPAIRFKLTTSNRLACYYWLQGSQRRTTVTWRMQHAPGVDMNVICESLNEKARNAEQSGASPVHIDSAINSNDTPSDKPPKITEPPPWHNSVAMGGIIMGDVYNVSGQAGVVGPYAHAHDMTFTQIGAQIEKSVNLSQLADELSNLRQAMKAEANDGERDISIGEISRAEQAARSGNSAKVAVYLKSAGMWALEIATKIGTTIATEALKTALGVQ